jgi:hypothetical protein
MTIYDVGSGKNTITVQQAISYAQAAGFSGQSLVDAVAIAMAESGLDTNSTNTTTSGVGLDRGIVKFNSVFHSDVPDSCAYDPACAFREFFRVSKQGTTFCEWCTYTTQCGQANCTADGGYKSNLATVQAAMGGQTGTSTIGSFSPTSFLPTDLLSWLSDPIRMLKMALGIILIFISIFLLMVPQAEQNAKDLLKFSGEGQTG